MCLCVYCRSNKCYLCNTSDQKCVEKLWNQRIKLVIFHSFLTVITLRHIWNTRSTMNWTLTSVVCLTGPDSMYSVLKNTWIRSIYSSYLYDWIGRLWMTPKKTSPLPNDVIVATHQWRAYLTFVLHLVRVRKRSWFGLTTFLGYSSKGFVTKNAKKVIVSSS